MIIAPITAAPDVETFFNEVSHNVSRTSKKSMSKKSMQTATDPQKSIVESIVNDSVIIGSECPATRHDGPEEGTDTPEGFTPEAEAISEGFITEPIVTDAFTPDAFTPDTADKVDWVLGKIADRRARAQRIRENAEMMAKSEEREADALEWRYGPALQAWARRELEGGKRKSIRLFQGVIGFRTRPAGLDVVDPAATLEWAKENCREAVIERLDKKALADTLLSTGEVLPFARFSPSEEVFFVK